MGLASTLETLRYRTPVGKVDIPYAYVFDCTALTDGLSYTYLSQYIDNDSDFVLRDISGASLCASTFRPYYSTRTMMFQNLIRTTANWPVMPEAFFPHGSQILFDLGTVSRAFNQASTEPKIYTSYLAFQGVRRYDEKQFPIYRTPYDYREIPRNYSLVIHPGSAWTDAVNGIQNGSKIFSIPMLEGDFELFGVGVVDLQTFLPPTFNPFTMRLFDAQGWYRFSDPGFNCFYFSALAPQIQAAPAVNAWYKPQYPTPSTVYPEAGAIKFEIQSLLPFADAANAYQINFYGIQRTRNAVHFSGASA